MSLATLSPEQRELFDLLSRRDRPETPPPEPIAVIGIGCRFPGGAHDPDSFWRLLVEGRDAVREVPRERWDIDAYYDPNPDAPGKMWTRSGGFLDEVDRFDAAFFGISPREATWMDPQQRLLLEVCWEALENSGIAPDSLAGSRTGVFGGISTSDYFRFVYADRERISAYGATGTVVSAAAGRVSYVFGLQGPCIAVDTACSSSLVSIHLACQSLRQKECEIALAGGVSLILAPETSINFTKARMLAPDGRSKTFDAAADGYGRGEGCGMLVLKPLSRARRDGDTVWGVILGSAVNQDGRSNGLTAPNPAAQEELLRTALVAARVKPGDVSYIEAHGTGTPLGDPIELGALAAVLGRDRRKDRPLRIGTVKTNIGHLEIAAGVAGLIKTLLCLRHRALVPNLHFRQLNPKIAAAIGELPIEICQHNEPWEAANGRLIAGVSSFGFGGTNAHVILEGGWPEKGSGFGVQGSGEFGSGDGVVLPLPPGEGRDAAFDVSPESSLHLLCLSAKTPAALTALAHTYSDYLSHTDADVADICYTANTGRAHFDHRLAVVGATCRELSDKLLALIANEGSTAALGCGPRNAAQPTNGDLTNPHALAAHYQQGATIDWRAVYANRHHRRVALPTYPFQRERYWLDRTVERASSLASSVGRPSQVVDPVGRPSQVVRIDGLGNPPHEQLAPSAHPLLGRRVRTATREIIYEAHITPAWPAWLADHVVRGSVVVPGAAFADLALSAARLALPPSTDYRLLSTNLPQFLPLNLAGRVLQTVLAPQADGAWQFACLSADPASGAEAAWTTHATGTIAPGDSTAADPVMSVDEARALCTRQREAAEYYRALGAAGLDYGPAFRGIAELCFGDRLALARILMPAELAANAEDYAAHPAMLDSCLQTFLGALDGATALYVPAGWESFGMHPPLSLGDGWGGEVWAIANLTDCNDAPDCSDRLTGELTIFACTGQPLIHWSGIRLQRVATSTVSKPQCESIAAAPQPSPADAVMEPNNGDLLTAVHDCAARVLELPPGERIDPEDNLYDLGMDSIMATELLFHIEKSLDCSLPMQAMAKARTLTQIVEMVRSKRKDVVAK